jgi:Domain of unknown function (DUF5666)
MWFARKPVANVSFSGEPAMNYPRFSTDGGALARGRSLAGLLLAMLLAALTVAACGGGGGGVDPGTGGTGSFSRGAITGFGSIIVNGVRHDNSSASVSDEDDEDRPGRSNDDLKLGMVVTVSGTAGSGTGTATASVITFGSELKGPVQSINGSTMTATSTTSTGTGTGTGTPTVVTGTQTLVILGQTVIVGTRTVFDPLSLPGGFADIKVGNVLEIHGHLDPAANKLMATRINLEDNANAYKITGNISSLSTGSKSFKIGSETISYSAINPDKLRVTPANGLTVKVRLSTSQTVTGTWDATRIKPAAKKAENRNKAELEGIITAFTNTSTFSVDGIPVDAGNARFDKGTAGIKLGARVEVKGSIVDGTLIASRVKLEEDNDEDNRNELHCVVTDLVAIDKTFKACGVIVKYSDATTFKDGRVEDLKNGAKVEVKGTLAPGGTTVQAASIEFEN